ncbi:MAG TPA: peptidoglycan-binding protein [Candidatus Binatia bacterium]|nr:peptidoglycan-binding protein [Candidatus Binatia bacterium]
MLYIRVNFAVIALALSLPAYLYAQEISPKAEGTETMISVQALVNSKVLDRDNKQMGTVKNLMLDPKSGKLVRADIALGRGGFLGIQTGEQRVSVPWEQLSVKRQEGELVLVMNQEFVERIKTEQTKQTSQQQQRASEAKGSGGGTETQPPAAQSKQQPLAAGSQQVTASADEIRRAEEALKAKGLNPGPIDGKMDSQTQEALREFQKQNNLMVTGSLDQQTAERLGVKLSAGVSSSAPGQQSPPLDTTSDSSQTK